jgi:hypothetical protein
MSSYPGKRALDVLAAGTACAGKRKIRRFLQRGAY